MQIKFVVISLTVLLSLSGCSQWPYVLATRNLPSSFIGTWKGDDTATAGIMGTVIITKDTIRFGKNADTKEPVCSANYTVQKNNQTKTYLLILHNKQCQYKIALNPGWLKPYNTLNIYMSKQAFGHKTTREENRQIKPAKMPYLFIQSLHGGTDFRFFHASKIHH